MNNKSKVALYVRTRKHSDADSSLSDQLQVMRKFAVAQNFNVVKEYVDDCCEGHRDTGALNSLLTSAEKNEFNSVLIYSMSRMPMCLKDFYDLCRALEKLNINVVSTADEPFDSGSDAGKWILGYMSLITESVEFENKCREGNQFQN